MPGKIKSREDLNIPPAKGQVKVRSKQQKEPVERQKPQVIENVGPVPPVSEMEPPTDEARKILMKSQEAKAEFFNAIKNLNKLFSRKTLPENRSLFEQQEEQAAVDKIIRAAIAVEDFSDREGILGLCVLSIRHNLLLRDAGNRLAYKVKMLQDKIEKLEKENEGEG